MDRRNRMTLLLALALAGPATRGLAQSPCELKLHESEALYQEGRIPEARHAAEGCLAALPTRDEKAAAAELLTKIDLAEDDVAAARRRLVDLLRDEPRFEPNTANDPPRLLRLVEQVRQETGTVQVSSVSKTPESLREAPATVVVVTHEEIERRGYHDLEEVLHDLPGFDISRTNGLPYSSFYQRGYRSDLTARTQLMVDGVEENELWTGIAYLSRQYPLTDIDRVEVVYGPSSTFYGANAFAGVINVITRSPESFLPGEQRFGLLAEAGAGSLNTRSFDSTVAGRTANHAVSWALTTRSFQSDEMDLSGRAAWDYQMDPATYAQSLEVTGQDSRGSYKAQAYLNQLPAGKPLPDSPYYQVVRNGQGVATAIRLTPLGLQRAEALDRSALADVHGTPARFNDGTNDWAVHGKVELANLELGFQIWRQAEGANPSYGERGQAPGGTGMLWIPEQTWFYAKYSRELSRELSLTFFSRYKLHQLADPTGTNLFLGYSGGKLGLTDLAHDTPASWKTQYFYQSNTQLANELSLVYNRSPRFSLVSGIEARDTSVQGNYVLSGQPLPAETGSDAPVAGGNRFNIIDLALYSQLSYRLRPDLRVVAGGRLDNNRVRSSDGYGTVFSPRLALIYSRGPLVLKGIYSEAFQDASQLQKYVQVVPSSVGNPDLTPERAKNFELSVGVEPAKGLSFELVGYDTRYTGIPQLQPVLCTAAIAGSCTTEFINQFQSAGAREIRGVQATASWVRGRRSLTANYTFTDPRNTQLDVRVGDIASHHLNIVGSAPLGRHLDLTARFNAVSARRTGKGTDVDANPYTSIPGYAVIGTALTWSDPLPHTKLQLAVDNLLDKAYDDPGIRRADALAYAARVPQPGRGVTLRLTASF